MTSNTMHTAGRDVRLASVIIPTYQRAQFLRDAVSSVRQQTLTEGFEILVVDNAPSDELREYVDSLASEDGPTVRYAPEPREGLHNVRHAGARAARGEILVYVDDDVVVPPGWLEALLQPYADPLVGCVGGKTLPKWEADPPPWLEQFGGNGGGNLSLLDLGDETLELAWPQTVYGCNMSVRRSVLYEVGGFNPDTLGDQRLIWLRGDGETGLQRKLYAAGYTVIYEPRAWLYHQVPTSRLRPEYFYWRAFIQGISDSYTHMRTNRFPVIRLVARAGYWGLRAGLSYLNLLRHPDQQVRCKARASYWYGRAQHQLRLALSPALRRHVLQETYL